MKQWFPRIPPLFLSLACILSLSLFFLFLFLFFSTIPLSSTSSPSSSFKFSSQPIKVYVADLPRSLNYGLLDQYWSLTHDSRLGSDADAPVRSSLSSSKPNIEFPPYPENPLIKQYSAEYWILSDLMTPGRLRAGSIAMRVFDTGDADVIFVPFFATLSAEMQLGIDKGKFTKKVGNEDYERQRELVDLIRSSDAWRRSGGRDKNCFRSHGPSCNVAC